MPCFFWHSSTIPCAKSSKRQAVSPHRRYGVLACGDYKNLKKSVEAFLESHPDWKDRLPDALDALASGNLSPKDEEMLWWLRNLCYERGLEHDFLAELITYEGSLNERTGQFFTPEPAARLMVEMMGIPEQLKAAEEEDRTVSIAEPSCGTGTFVVAVYASCIRKGIDFRRAHWFCIDIDRAAAAACAFNCLIRGINAEVVHGDGLRQKWFSVWTVKYDDKRREVLIKNSTPQRSKIETKALKGQ